MKYCGILIVCSLLACNAPRSRPGVHPSLAVSGIILESGEQPCLGTLVADDAIVTSARCAARVWERRYAFIPHGSNLGDPYAHLVRSATFHPSADLAVLFLEDPLPGAAHAAIPGAADETRLRQARNFEYVTLPASQPPMQVVSAPVQRVGDASLHLGPLPSTCYAVVGGPVFSPATDGGPALRQLVGVISGPSRQGGTCADGLVVTRMDPAWLNQAMTAACGTGERVACAASQSRGALRQGIVAGAPADGRFASAAALMVGFELSCSAVLIEPDLALTAAHCVEGVATTHRLELRFGARTEPQVWRSTALVRHVESHPNFSMDTCTPAAMAEPRRLAACRELVSACPATMPRAERDTCLTQLPADLLTRAGIFGVGAANDVALLFLAHPVAAASPAPLLQEPALLAAETELTSVGYGQHSPERLQVSDGGERYLAINRVADLNDSELQLGTEPPQGCWGDSGGPAYIKVGEQWQLAGIASRLTDSFACDSGQTFTRVDPLGDWLERSAREACLHEQRASCRLPPHEQPVGGEAAGLRPLQTPPTPAAGCGAAMPLPWLVVAWALGCRRRR